MKKQNIHVPFHIKIPAGHSKFIIPVPKAFNDRIFDFTDLTLVPDYYALLAADYEMDTDEELNQIVEFEIFLSAMFSENPFPVEPFEKPASVKTTPELAKWINDRFEETRPNGYYHLGVFFDWTDLSFVPGGDQSWDDYVIEKSMEYYGVPFDKRLHFNALPLSARDVPGANNYLFPTEPGDETAMSLRFRMNVTPNARAMYSTDLQLLDFGFSAAQIGPRQSNKKFFFSNKHSNEFQTFTAAGEYNDDLNKRTVFRVSMTIYRKMMETETEKVQVTRQKMRVNTEMFNAVQKTLHDISNECNLEVSVTYDPEKKRFTFHFPENPKISITIHPAEELSNRLGFNLISDITKRNATSTEKKEDTPDMREAEKKARALVNDTSIVMVTDDNSFSMTTVGVSEKLMASLMPDGPYLKMSRGDDSPPKMRLPSVFTGSAADVPATFKLHRFLDDGHPTNLQWKHDGYIYGVLRGTTSVDH
jgi:hypothetical protein